MSGLSGLGAAGRGSGMGEVPDGSITPFKMGFGVMRRLISDRVVTTVENTVAKTTLKSVTVPAGELALGGTLYAVFAGSFINNTGAARLAAMTLEVGGSVFTRVNLNHGVSAAEQYNWYELIVYARAVDTVKYMFASHWTDINVLPQGTFGSPGQGRTFRVNAEDFSVPVDIVWTVTPAFASADFQFICRAVDISVMQE